MHNNYDLIVIGGGILGTFHAYAALRKGLKTALIERDAAPRSATVRNFGQIVPSGMRPEWQAIGRESLRIYRDLHTVANLGMRAEGSIYVAHDEVEEQLLLELAAVNKEQGYTSQMYTAAECLAKYPGLRSDYCRSGLFFPEEISLDPRVAVHRALEFSVRHLGLAYFPQTTVLSLTTTENGVSCTDQFGVIRKAGQAVVCAGNDFQTLFPEVYAAADLQVCQLQMLTTVPQPSTYRLPGNILTGRTIRRYEAFKDLPSFATASKMQVNGDFKVAKTESSSNAYAHRFGVHLLFKQANDGSVIIGDSHIYADRESELPFDRDEALDQFMMQEAQAIIELPDYRLARRWLGVYAQCKSSDIFTKTLEDRIHLVAGIGGKGMTAGPGFSARQIEQLFPGINQRSVFFNQMRPELTSINGLKLVVFDMAGTTVDEGNTVYLTLQKTIQAAGYPVTLETVLSLAAGREKRDGILRCLLDYGLEATEAQTLSKELYTDFSQRLAKAYADNNAIKAKEGADALFFSLKAKGIKVALNTGYSRPIAESLIQQIGWAVGQEIDGLVTASDVATGRPAPDMIELLRHQFGIEQSEAVAKVGDSAVDVAEGRNAGCGLVVGITTGAHTRDQLALAAPDAVVDSLVELSRLLHPQP